MVHGLPSAVTASYDAQDHVGGTYPTIRSTGEHDDKRLLDARAEGPRRLAQHGRIFRDSAQLNHDPRLTAQVTSIPAHCSWSNPEAATQHRPQRDESRRSFDQASGAVLLIASQNVASAE